MISAVSYSESPTKKRSSTTRLPLGRVMPAGRAIRRPQSTLVAFPRQNRRPIQRNPGEGSSTPEGIVPAGVIHENAAHHCCSDPETVVAVAPFNLLMVQAKVGLVPGQWSVACGLLLHLANSRKPVGGVHHRFVESIRRGGFEGVRTGAVATQGPMQQ